MSFFEFKNDWLQGNELLYIALAFILITSTLVNIDRSRSVFVLKWVSEIGQTGTTITEIQKWKRLSVADMDAISQRIREQEQMRLLLTINGKVYLTNLGKIAVFLFRELSDLENLNGYKNA